MKVCRGTGRMGRLGIVANSVLLAAMFLHTADAFAAKTAATPGQPLTGQIRTPLMQAQMGLAEIDKSSQMLQRTALEMISEVERSQWVVATMPDAFGPIIVPQIAFPNQGLGELEPPRKKWIDYYMKQLSSLIDLVNEDISSTVLPSNASPDVTASWKQMKSLMGDVATHYSALQAVTQGKLDNIPIGKQVLPIYDDINKLRAVNKRLLHFVRWDEHQVAKTAKDAKEAGE